MKTPRASNRPTLDGMAGVLLDGDPVTITLPVPGGAEAVTVTALSTGPSFDVGEVMVGCPGRPTTAGAGRREMRISLGAFCRS